jgi:Ca2+-binding RTX toxin-like protein
VQQAASRGLSHFADDPSFEDEERKAAAHRLEAGLGKDRLIGGGQADKFIFNSKLSLSNVDAIHDFTHDTDLIQLDDAIFKTIRRLTG